MKSRSPLVNRIAIVVCAVVLTSMVSMATTLAVSKSIEGNATAINLAGALRMGAFRLLSHVGGAKESSVGENSIQNMTSRYELSLRNNNIVRAISATEDHPLTSSTKLSEHYWEQTLRPGLENHPQGSSASADILAATQSYVNSVDQLVNMLERRTEARIGLLHLIQIISLAFSILIIVALFVDLRSRVLKPLRKLVSIAKAVGEQDFSHKANMKGSDELAQLGSAFDQMSSELALTYFDLEERARSKTEELEKSHAALQLLHASSRNLFANHDLCSGAVPMLQELEQLLGIGPIRLYLHDKQSVRARSGGYNGINRTPFLLSRPPLQRLPGNAGRLRRVTHRRPRWSQAATAYPNSG